ncbi:NAD(P)/FAD-dependent oxidoreductase [Hansschlegelia quercus]|uniref:FAD-dependent oxidoreductase n=1 Tax=Hansschlegelia quercus TaxID=2528245 RepID=A0A4Q9GMK0_9HYPH|nr:FAD-dependent oxidoreductase [Hansschlegelia quercus]TBN52413.1 FAD-dependent oxidoreductase [Hansschlegelia quercus]
MKVVVIGGGAVGVASASFALREGHEVTLIEPGEIAEGATFGNAGCLNASSVVPMSMPGNLPKVPGWLVDPLGPLSIRWGYAPKIAPWIYRFLKAGSRDRVEAQAKALAGLLRDSYGSYQPLVKNAGAEGLLRRQGHLVVYRSKKDFDGDALGWRLRRDNGVAFDVLTSDALWQQEPSLSHDYGIGVFVPDNGHTVNPNRLVSTLADAFVRDGGTIKRARAIGFDLEGDRLQAVRTADGCVEADRAVVAAGAWSKPLAKELGDDVPLDTERGYHIVIKDPEVGPRSSILDATGKFVATSMEMGLRLAGTVEFAGLDAEPDWRRARMLLTLGQRLFPGLRRAYPEERLTQWMGFRPSMPDSLPVIGRASRSPDVIYAFGHGHIGLASGARTGEVVADLLADRTPSIPIEAFAPTRA